jgi:hypothetical protein
LASTTPSPLARVVEDVSLAGIVVKDENLSPEAGTFGTATLSVFRTVAGAAAFREAGVAEEVPDGLTWAMLSEFDSDDDHEGKHEDRYRSFAAAFETVTDAQQAFLAAVDYHQSPSGWGFTRQRDGLVINVISFLGDEGMHYAVGRDYGYPELRVYLWRRANLLLQAVDFHPYDRTALLRSVAISMDLRAASVVR